MANLPCKDLFDDMEKAMKAFEQCWDSVGENQVLVTVGGILTVSTCSAALPALLTANPAAILKIWAECAAGIGASFAGFVLWIVQMNQCSELDLDAEKIAKDFEKCTAKHKDVLNAAAAAQGNS